MITPKVSVEKRGYDRYMKTLARNEGKPLKDRAQRVINAAAKRRVVAALKSVAPKGPNRPSKRGPIAMVGQKRRKKMRTSAKAKLLRRRAGEDIKPTWVGYSAAHAVMVVGGTKTHQLDLRGGTFTSARSSGGRFSRLGRWTTRGNYRSAYAYFSLGDKEVRPLAGITVRGLKPGDHVTKGWNQGRTSFLDDVERDTFAIK